MDAKKILFFIVTLGILLPMILAIAPSFSITIHSPQNTVYNSDSIDLNVSARDVAGAFEPEVWWYSIDGGTNITFTPNITISDLSEGSHNLVVYANDTEGNVVVSNLQFDSVYEEWNRTFGGSGSDGGYSVQQTSDGGYVIGGYTSSFGGGGWNFWLVKTDFLGNPKWNRTFGGSDADLGRSVQQTSDGGYILVGYTRSFGVGGDDFWLIKTNSSGDHVWNKTFGGASDEKAYSVQQTSDGGYIIGGYTSSFGVGGGDFWLVKTNSSGDHEWNRTFGGSSGDYGESVQQTSDGGYLLAGMTTSSFGAGSNDFWLVKTNSSGDHEWNRTFGGTNSDKAYSVQQTTDGGYILAGGTSSFGAGSNDFWLVKTNSSGDHEWNRTFGGASDDEAYSVQQTSDGGYILAGETQSFGAGGYDFWLVKTNSSGDHEWNRTLGGSSNDQANSIKQMSDGGYIFAGETQSFGVGNKDFWLVKVKATGENYFSVDTPPVITIDSPQDGVTNNNTPLLNATFSEVVDTAWYSIDDGANQSYATATSNLTLTLSPLLEGNHNITVYANDSLGNTGSRVVYFTVDTSPPVITIDSPQDGVTNDNTSLLNATFGEVVDTAWYSVDDGINQSYVTATSNLTLILSTLSEGDHDITVYANDSAGNTGTKVVYFTVDSTPPGITINSPQNGTVVNDDTPLLNATFGEVVDTAWYSIDDGANQSYATATSNLTLTLLSPLLEGNHNITVYANDSLGNVEESIVYFNIDLTPPSILINSPQNRTYNTSSITLDIEASDSNLESTWYNINGTNITYIEPLSFNLANGTHTITAYANDSAGNLNSTNVTFNIDIIDSSNSIINQELNTTNNQTNFTVGDITVIIETMQELNETIDITTYIDNPPNTDEASSSHGLASNEQGVGRYIHFEPSENINDTSGNLSWVYFKVNYSEIDYSNVDESTLKFFWWNGTSWRSITTGANYTSENNGPYVYEAGVDTANKFMWANLTHFSTYTIAGSTPIVLTPETPTHSGGGGSSGGDRGIGVEGVLIGTIKASGTGLAKFDLSNTKYISKIELTSNEDVYNVKVTAEALNEKPYMSMLEPEGDKIRITNDQITEAKISFRVPVSWIEEKGINSITLKRYVNGQWEELETEYLSEDGTNVYYNAKSSGFSYFVITGSTESQGYKEPEIKEPTTEVEQKKKKITTLGVVLIIVLMVMVGYLFLEKVVTKV
jgi:PGF-pre-PGF domain-containing protein/uncharacterized delta-60 repeat protein